ncbi:adenosylmethionine-8-amino-7-oxononanoate aminotransferase [Bradyrhizobium sp. GM7.3]
MGSTGTLFACEQANVTPDIACYSKGLTGGALPLSVTLCRAQIFGARTIRKDRTQTFFHSRSYTANPIACAAAKANLDLWQDAEARKRLASIVTMQEQAIEPFRTDSRFANVRRIGTITALDPKTRDAVISRASVRSFALPSSRETSCCVHSEIRST